MECVRGLREHASANLHERAVQILGNDRNTLRKKLIEHGIDPDAVEG